MINKILFLITMLLFTNLAISQGDSFDCPNATPICSNIYDFFDSPVGVGTISEGQVNGGCLQGGETNSSWFVFTAQESGQIGFGIITGVGQEDYDWAIWDISESGCDQVNNDLPISCNYSGTNALTGPTGGTNQISGDAGSNPENDLVNVISGNTYAILIDNWAGTSTGFTVDFASYSPTSIIDTITPRVTKAKMVTCNSNKVSLKFSENVNCSTVEASDFLITGPQGNFSVTNIASPQCGNPIGTGQFEQDFQYILTLNQIPTIPGTYSIIVIEDSIQDLCGNASPADTFNFKIVDASFEGFPDTLCPSKEIILNTVNSEASPCVYVKLVASLDNLNNTVQLLENGIDNWGVQNFSSGMEQIIYFDNIIKALNHSLIFNTNATTPGARIDYFIYNCVNDDLLSSGNFYGNNTVVNFNTSGLGIVSTYTSTCPNLITNNGNGTAIFDPSSVNGPYPFTCNVSYSFNDGNGCVSSVTNTLLVDDIYDASFSYDQNSYCKSDTNPIPTLIENTNGYFYSTDTSIVVDSISGEIILDSCKVGSYFVSHVIGIGVCEKIDSVKIEIFDIGVAPEIFGSNSVCPDLEDVLYWSDDLNIYNWEVVGGVISNGANNDTTSIDWGVSNANAIVKLYGENLDGCVTDTGFFDVIVNTLLTTETPNGIDTMCYFSSQNIDYSISNTNGSVYLWELDFGNLNSGDSTNQISVTWDTVGTGFIYIKEQSTTSTSVCYGESDTLFVQVLPSPDTSLQIIDTTIICENSDSVLFYLNGYSTSNYLWESTGGIIIQNGINPLMINWDTDGLFEVSVLETTELGCIGDTIKESIEIKPLPNTVFNEGLLTICPQILDSNEYSVDGFVNSDFNWYVTGGSIIGDSTKSNIMIDWDTLNNKFINVLETTEYGCFDTVVSFPIYYDPSRISFSYLSDNYVDDKLIELNWDFFTNDTLIDWVYLFRNEILLDSFDVTTNSFVDGPLPTDVNNYNYYVSAYNTCDFNLISNLHKSVLLESSVKENEQIEIKWNNYKGWGYDGIYEYKLLKSIDDSDFEIVESTNDTILTFNNSEDGFKHCYRVQAIKNSTREVISWSNISCIQFDHIVKVYNAITPNGDGLNDFFVVDKLSLYPENELQIYNRWGNLIYSKYEYNNEWDGGNLPDGTYYYILKIEEDVYKGDITLQR